MQAPGIQFQKKFLFAQVASFLLGSQAEDGTTTQSPKLKIVVSS